MSLQGQRALARLFGLEVDTDAPPADPAPTGLEWKGGVRSPPPTHRPYPTTTAHPTSTAAPARHRPGAGDPEGDHGELVKHLLAPRDPGVYPVTATSRTAGEAQPAASSFPVGGGQPAQAPERTAGVASGARQIGELG